MQWSILGSTRSNWTNCQAACERCIDADVADVQPLHRGEAPAGAKAGEVAVIGTSSVALAQSAEAFTSVVHAVRNGSLVILFAG